MSKKIEEAVDEIILLYCSGASAADAINTVLEKLKSRDQFKLIDLLQKVLENKI